jgi:signal recognition particle receptor subunit beta
MALFNYAAREISAKIVYYGPGLSGKTTNIESIYSMLQSDQRGKLISLPTETDRTLFFDFLPVELGKIKGFTVRFHLYTVPGQVFYNQTRKLVLQGVDGVVFVADSQVNMLDSDLESLSNLEENLASYGKKLEELPFVIQYNKRDLKNIMSPDQMNSELNKNNVPIFNAIAITGEGVKETLMEIAKLVFNHLRKTLLLESEIGTLKEEEIGEIVGREIDERFVSEPEEIEDIDDVEELPAEADLSINFGELSAGDGMQEESVDVDAKSIDVDPGANISEAVETPEDYEIEEEHDPDWGEGDIAGLLDEIEIEEEIEVAEEPMKETKDVALSVESEGLTFIRLENPYISLEGDAVIPAVFFNKEGNEVIVKIKISVDKG